MKGKYRNIYPGGNTPFGFYSYYNYIIDQNKAEIKYCIKGGPGTGKSTFMKRIADYFLDKGEDVDYFWCSSDPSSLDGILLKQRNIAFVDGTYPHITDPLNPGAVDKIIDFSKFWDEKRIRDNRDKIIYYNEKISGLYGMAYGYLKYLYYQYQLIEKLLKDLIDEKKEHDVLSRCIEELSLDRKEGKGSRKKFFLSAITPEGVVNGINSFTGIAERIISINVTVGYRSEKILKYLEEYLVENGFDVELYYCPMDPERKLEHIFVPDLSLLITSCNIYHNIKADHIGDVLIESYRNDFANDLLFELYGSADNTLYSAIKVLKKAKSLHDDLEKCYIESVDFNAVDESCHDMIYRIKNNK